jgi:predicted glutamine amidotransferase
MCIIAIQPIGKKIKDSTLRNCWDNNNDGAGIMYAMDGKVIVHKELYSFEKFLAHKKQIDKLGVNIVLHFRISTSGMIDKNNIHPFKVNENLYFCHNGILDIHVPNDSKVNDTQIYNNVFLKGMHPKFIYNESTRNLIQYSIGQRNKFVFLDNKGQFFILNEQQGSWVDGVWYSNETYSYSYKGYSYKAKSTKIQPPTFEPAECECCGCLHTELMYSTEWDMDICPSCIEFAELKY